MNDARPTGTVTLHFTDIEGSTRHWEEQREAMAVALRLHDELLLWGPGGTYAMTSPDAGWKRLVEEPSRLLSTGDDRRPAAGIFRNGLKGMDNSYDRAE